VKRQRLRGHAFIVILDYDSADGKRRYFERVVINLRTTRTYNWLRCVRPVVWFMHTFIWSIAPVLTDERVH